MEEMAKKKEIGEIVDGETLQGSPVHCTNPNYGEPQAINQAVRGEVVEHMNNLIAAANIAQKNGVFTLEEAATVWHSVERLNEIING